MKKYLKGNYLLALMTMLVSFLGLFVARGVIVGTIVALPTINSFFEDILVNTRPEILGFDSVIPVLPVCILLFGLFIGLFIAISAVQIFCNALNAVRILNGDGEAVKGIVIKLPFSNKSIITKPEVQQKERD